MRLLFALCLLIGGRSFAADVDGGGWVSSGGESLIYAKNPWFLKNVTRVAYCLEMDETAFSISRAEAARAIAEAFTYWKSEFAINRGTTDLQLGFAAIATQDFTIADHCAETTPVVFKLGLSRLDPAEIAFLKEPKKFIGVTIRKTYSLTELKGSGVIYLSADRGPDAYANNGQMISEAWRSPALFRYAVIHELGHLFGIPHVGTGIMSEVFMPILLNKSMAPSFEKSPDLSFLNAQRNFEVCRNTAAFNPDFFKVGKGISCLRFEWSSSPGLPQWRVFTRAEPPAADTEVGTVQALALNQSVASLKPAVIVQLPEEQTVFRPTETLTGAFVMGGVFSDTSYEGSYRPKDSIRGQSLQMSLSADKISLVGLVNGQQALVMNYSPIGFLKTVLP